MKFGKAFTSNYGTGYHEEICILFCNNRLKADGCFSCDNCTAMCNGIDWLFIYPLAGYIRTALIVLCEYALHFTTITQKIWVFANFSSVLD
jgi:hypothetical protein